jgi:penicillin-binding protein 1C
MRDNWCVGYSSRYTVGVWVGNASGAPMWDVSGVTGAAPVWQEVMQYLHERGRNGARDAGNGPPAKPAGVQAQTIRYEQDVEAARTEYFYRAPPRPRSAWCMHAIFVRPSLIPQQACLLRWTLISRRRGSASASAPRARLQAAAGCWMGR